LLFVVGEGVFELETGLAVGVFFGEGLQSVLGELTEGMTVAGLSGNEVDRGEIELETLNTATTRIKPTIPKTTK